MIARIHVNQHRIKSNAKTGKREPVITIKTSRGNEYAHEVSIIGPSHVIYSPDKPLACGAKLWIECKREDVIIKEFPTATPVADLIREAVADCEVR